MSTSDSVITHQMRIYLENKRAKFHSDPVQDRDEIHLKRRSFPVAYLEGGRTGSQRSKH